MNPRILIVEDNEITAYEFQVVLERHGYKNVTTCSKGEDAIKIAEDNQDGPHLYIMDIALKGSIDGLDTAKKIKAFNPNAHFIFISGEEEKIRIARSIGITFLLVKPIDNDELLMIVRIIVSELQFLEKPFVLEDSIFLYKNKNCERIRANDISVLETEAGTTTIFTKNGEKYIYSAGLSTFMYHWDKAVAQNKNLPNSLHHISAKHAVNVINVESYGPETGIKVKGYDKFIPYSKKLCPYFEQMFIRIKMSKPSRNNGEDKDKTNVST